MAKTYKDGWHEVSEYLRYYVEDGKLMRGVRSNGHGSERAVYPYKPSKHGGLDNCAGCPATYYWVSRVEWI